MAGLKIKILIIQILIIYLLNCVSFNVYAKERSFIVNVSGKGQAMLFLPGINASYKVWGGTVERFKKTHQTHTFNLNGFAGLPLKGEPSLERVKKDLFAYIDENKLNKPIIVGHGIGGTLALQAAIEKPELFGAIVILETLPSYAGIMNPNIGEADMKVLASNIANTLLESSVEDLTNFYRNLVPTMVVDDQQQKILFDWAMISDKKMSSHAMYVMNATDLRTPIAKIKSPTLILGSWAVAKVQGGNKADHTSMFKQQYRHLPNHKIFIHDNARHYMMLDAQAWVNEKIETFITAKN